jgi:hypothetical protein
MNISHNYSSLGDDYGVCKGSIEQDTTVEHSPKCMDEETLRELICIPSPLFLDKPDFGE